MPANLNNIRRALSQSDNIAQLPLFSEQAKKQAGMKLAARGNPEMLDRFRRIAKYLWDTYGENITIDSVRNFADDEGIVYSPGCWMGSVFSGKEWACVGFMAADHVGSHGRAVRVWKGN